MANTGSIINKIFLSFELFLHYGALCCSNCPPRTIFFTPEELTSMSDSRGILYLGCGTRTPIYETSNAELSKDGEEIE